MHTLPHRALCAALTLLCPLALWAQVTFDVDDERQWIGEVLWQTPRTVNFHITNTSDQPLRVTEVQPSCGCVKVTWPTSPVMPGQSAQVSATYDARMLGTFYRELAVYVEGLEDATYLAFEGCVVTEQSESAIEDHFPIDLGNIRLSTNVIEFDDVNLGDRPVAELRVKNVTKEAFTPQLMHLPPYLTAEALPPTIQGSRTGLIRLTLDSEKLMMNGLNQCSIYMTRHTGDKVGQDNEIVVSAILLPSFANLSASQMATAPRIVFMDGDEMLTTDINLPGNNDKKVSKTIAVTNVGGTPLNISAVQVMNQAVSVSLGDRVIEPHATTKMKVTVDMKVMARTKTPPRLLIISDDPRQAKTQLNINIEE